jgi:hypothetical protein
MFGNLSHSVFEAEIKIEPISFYGCSSSESEAKPPDSVGAPSAPADYLTLTLQEPPKKRKPQACKICGKILSSTSSYYVHMKLHSGNKPFQCTQCDACFCRKPYLEVTGGRVTTPTRSICCRCTCGRTRGSAPSSATSARSASRRSPV